MPEPAADGPSPPRAEANPAIAPDTSTTAPSADADAIVEAFIVLNGSASSQPGTA